MSFALAWDLLLSVFLFTLDTAVHRWAAVYRVPTWKRIEHLAQWESYKHIVPKLNTLHSLALCLPYILLRDLLTRRKLNFVSKNQWWFVLRNYSNQYLAWTPMGWCLIRGRKPAYCYLWPSAWFGRNVCTWILPQSKHILFVIALARRASLSRLLLKRHKGVRHY